QAPGFVSFKSFAAEDGERVSLIEFESRDAAHQWGDHAEHRDAQKLGRERFFSEYTIQVCPPLRTAEFRRD
ncbi:MAG: antibiotic biosynthesis monooxygenase, partial [Myxococcales bacterium]|nr:antibiotic biosynthesis monooxygenase [Myxococcales bacterium]